MKRPIFLFPNLSAFSTSNEAMDVETLSDADDGGDDVAAGSTRLRIKTPGGLQIVSESG